VREIIIPPGCAGAQPYKTFIIDEVHGCPERLRRLLKSIEEPRARVFMMATTELGQGAGDIQSRASSSRLRAIGFTAIVDRLRAIAKDEAITIDEPALALVARRVRQPARPP